MIGVYSIILGAVIVACALILLRREFSKAYFIGQSSSTAKSAKEESIKSPTVDAAIDRMESLVTEMSEAFYDISGDLEGKYSVHEKEISLLNEKITLLEKNLAIQEKEFAKSKKQLDKIEIKKKKNESNMTAESNFDLETRIETRAISEEHLDEAKDKKSVTEVLNIPAKPVDEYIEENSVKARIIALRSQGYSLKQIAKELNIGLGEIQLILNMKRS